MQPSAEPPLRLLAEVSWSGSPLPAGRTHALLAALVAAGGRPVAEDRLVEEVWGRDDVPANPAKALQVVVSRVRAQTAPEVVARDGHGYRLALATEGVDALRLGSTALGAREAESRGDLVAARDLARAAVALPVADEGDGPLGEVRRTARRHRAVALAVLGRALSALGDHEEALGLLTASGGDDETSLAALLRSTAAVRGAPAALERYEQHRAALADRLGVDPGPTLQALHAELLAADRPVREGLRFATSPLIGRDDDLRALRAAVREARVVSILGPGGLGKTRLAHLLGLDAEHPVVRFVELVGVSAAEDVVGEVGSALGVRDSVSGRRVLTADQRADVRARIAQLLDQAPTLLILDNCEHVVGAVAELVAYLVASCRRLRVVTTTRAPLAIGAERVFPLGQLDDDAGAELFAQRASAARPGVALDPAAVRRVVRRLDGLPLAIELAAAKVRVMSVEDIDRRLVDRFALLRGGDRSAPDRHQTLVAVIDWSWNLLTEPERRALRWLSSFPDGFTLTAADGLLGADALEAVQTLVDQSLLSVLDAEGSVRFRMLETVREFGRMQLVGAGEDAAARDALLGWARAYARTHGEALWSIGQVEAARAVLAEENNLADALREAVALPDPATSAHLLAALGAFWMIKGENARIISLTGAVEAALEGWEPADDEVDAAVAAAAMMVMNTIVGEIVDARVCLALMTTYGDRATQPRTQALVRVLAAQDGKDPAATVKRLDELGSDPDRAVATLALMWGAHYRENDGDPEGAVAVAARGLALVRPEEDGPWMASLMHTFLASLHAQLGQYDEASVHARAALPGLDALEAVDDAVQVRSVLALGAMSRGDLTEAETWMAEIDELVSRRASANLGGAFATGVTRAELALARGDVAGGLRLYRVAVDQLRSIRYPGLGVPSGMEPWTLFGESAAVAAYAVHGSGDEGRDLLDLLRSKAVGVLGADRALMDFPVTGLVLFALGAWGLARGEGDSREAVRLVVLAQRFAYARYTLTMDLDSMLARAEARVPGLLAELGATYGTRSGPDLLEEARAVAERITSSARSS